MPKIVALYGRTATAEQDASLQMLELREYANSKSWRIAGEYIDRGIGGHATIRPEFERMVTDAREHKFDCVAVVSMDRVSRSIRALGSAIDELESIRVRVIALN